ncbi:Transposon TyH3 Gag-Pol polyprotein, partial [Hondaea fermentalgiana]
MTSNATDIANSILRGRTNVTPVAPLLREELEADWTTFKHRLLQHLRVSKCHPEAVDKAIKATGAAEEKSNDGTNAAEDAAKTKASEEAQDLNDYLLNELIKAFGRNFSTLVEHQNQLSGVKAWNDIVTTLETQSSNRFLNSYRRIFDHLSETKLRAALETSDGNTGYLTWHSRFQALALDFATQLGGPPEKAYTTVATMAIHMIQLHLGNEGLLSIHIPDGTTVFGLNELLARMRLVSKEYAGRPGGKSHHAPGHRDQSARSNSSKGPHGMRARNPREAITLDIAGPFPTPSYSKGHRYALIAKDLVSDYVYAFFLQDTKNMDQSLMKLRTLWHGTHQTAATIFVDAATYFLSRPVERLLDTWHWDTRISMPTGRNTKSPYERHFGPDGYAHGTHHVLNLTTGRITTSRAVIVYDKALLPNVSPNWSIHDPRFKENLPASHRLLAGTSAYGGVPRPRTQPRSTLRDKVIGSHAAQLSEDLELALGRQMNSSQQHEPVARQAPAPDASQADLLGPGNQALEPATPPDFSLPLDHSHSRPLSRIATTSDSKDDLGSESEIDDDQDSTYTSPPSSPAARKTVPDRTGASPAHAELGGRRSARKRTAAISRCGGGSQSGAKMTAYAATPTLNTVDAADVHPDPRTVADIRAMQPSRKEAWEESLQREFSNLVRTNTLEIAKPEEVRGHQLMNSKWVFKTKADGTLKSRLVCVGTNEPITSPLDVFSPTIDRTSLHIATVLALTRQWTVAQADVTGAFLMAKLGEDEKLFMRAPDGLNMPKGTPLRLRTSLYGLRSAPKRFNDHLTSILKDLGLKQSLVDKSLFFSTDALVTVHVDDLRIAAKPKRVDSIINGLSKALKITTERGDNLTYLGTDITIDSGKRTATLSQEKHCRKMLKDRKMDRINPVKAPLDRGIELPDHDKDEQDPRYRSMLGSLMYLLQTRPDMAF